MTGPRIHIELFEILDQASSQWVQVDVTDQFQKIRILFADDGFVTVLK